MQKIAKSRSQSLTFIQQIPRVVSQMIGYLPIERIKKTGISETKIVVKNNEIECFDCNHLRSGSTKASERGMKQMLIPFFHNLLTNG